MNKKQTAVEYLVEQLPPIQQEGLRYIIEEAKALDKKQKMDAYLAGQKDIATLIHQRFPMPQTMKEIELIEKGIEVNENGDQYFTETYGE